MTPKESIYEIESNLHDLQPYLNSKNAWVAKRAREKYEQLVNRFFRENKYFVKPEQRFPCLHDPVCFLKLMDSAMEYYELN